MKPLLARAVERYEQLHQSASAPDAKPLWQQLREILSLRNGMTKLSADHYFWMNLGNRQLYDGVDLASFGGTYQTIALHRRLNSPYWDAIVTDKLIMHSVFSRCDVPQPKMYGAACRFKRQMGDLPIFNTRGGLINFLKNDIGYPFFCKPIKGGSAKGCKRAESYDSESNTIRLADGGRITPEAFVDSLEDPEGWGFLFQEAMLPDPETEDLCGGSVSGCRIIMLVSDSGPEVFRVVWKLPAKGNYVDNFVKGKTGNLLADVDPVSGEVRRVVAGTFTDLKVNPPLPHCDRNIVGEQIPGWNKLKETMEAAALAFPGFRFQHWDVGLTSKGPVIYELNTAGDLYLTELAKGEGVFDKRFKAFLEQYDNKATRWHLAGGPPVDDGPAETKPFAAAPSKARESAAGAH
jgi:hypothetical protein